MTNLIKDDEGFVREIDHSDSPYRNDGFLTPPTPLQIARDYIAHHAHDFGVDDAAEIKSGAAQSMVTDPEAARLELLHVRSKTVDNIVVVEFDQTVGGIPIWNSRLSVRINSDDNSVIGSRSDLHHNIRIAMSPEAPDKSFHPFLLKGTPQIKGISDLKGVKINGTRSLIYAFCAEDRLEPAIEEEGAFQQQSPTLDLPELEGRYEEGYHLLVTEVLFSYTVEGWGDLNWKAFVNAENGDIVYLRSLVACVQGAIFAIDPVTQGCPTCTGATAAATLDNMRTTTPLLGLVAPPAGQNQGLKGEYIEMKDIDPPNIAPPSEPTGTDFVYASTTDNFSAVNAYYHCDFVFRYIQGFGIDVPSYFSGTAFPVPTDARGKGNAVNASCNGNASGNGIGKLLFGLVEGGEPVGIATALRVVLHEFGHGLLWNHVDSPNFGFAHSAGDSMAAIYADPHSQVVDKGLTFPFLTNSNPSVSRRHDRKVADGWAWFGSQYNTQYSGEQVLSTTLFRAYQSTGGGADDLAYKLFASQYMFYLIVKSCGLLSQTTTDPTVYVNALKQADMTTADFQGVPGGTNYKVIRWSFEQQGLYQAAGTAKPYTTKGLPPEVDVYINDGRAGEYEYLADWKSSPDIWNRNAADGQSDNQAPVAGQTNYIYARVSNRGTGPASNGLVKGYQRYAGTQGNWPGDWSQLATTSLPVQGDISSGGSQVVGPFEWVPNSSNSSVLMIASADDDASIVSNPVISGKTIPNWRLVPFDNNIAERSF